ncbi:hypothetical protein KIPB_012280 [Kipferlia bialata]|uniref:Protein kinase domain-containing protein n=1 Tax=Kipferlia bialata TaxID=797122 RepID=A0A9K3GMX0_9EUKA|nr:hypothetical protein KIPB_012280 [Kipferlia bialata]|eukprot:g12280.t1
MDPLDEGNAMERAQAIADTLEEALGEPVSFDELYARGERVGQGSFSESFEATDRRTGQRVAARFHPIARIGHHWDIRETLSVKQYMGFVETAEGGVHHRAPRGCFPPALPGTAPREVCMGWS